MSLNAPPDSASRVRRMRRTRARVAPRLPRPDRRARLVKRPRLGRRFDTRLEIAFAIVLALSTVASAWCAFQAQRWAGIEAQLFSEADAARSETLRLNDLANRAFLLDFSLFLEYNSAMLDGRTAVATQLYQRFPPNLRRATDAWLAARPYDEDTASVTPFDLPEYQSSERDESDRQAALASSLADEAHEANDRTDNYLGLTVIFAVVLFIGGVGSKFEERVLRIASFVFAMGVLAAVGSLIVIFSR